MSRCHYSCHYASYEYGILAKANPGQTSKARPALTASPGSRVPAQVRLWKPHFQVAFISSHFQQYHLRCAAAYGLVSSYLPHPKLAPPNSSSTITTHIVTLLLVCIVILSLHRYRPSLSLVIPPFIDIRALSLFIPVSFVYIRCSAGVASNLNGTAGIAVIARCPPPVTFPELCLITSGTPSCVECQACCLSSLMATYRERDLSSTADSPTSSTT